MFPSACMASVRERCPLVHLITNYVTVNDCANMTICAGGSPIMTDERKDVMDISGMSSAVVLNMGTLNERTVESMLLAGRIANENDVPVIFDPVGAGASSYRNGVADLILRKVRVSVIKGNEGEIGFLSGTGGRVRGVDSMGSDDGRESAESLASRYGCIVGVSGAVDHVSDGRRTMILSNGDGLMGRVSGTGCMLSAVVGAYVGANGPSVESVASAITALNVSGEIAAKTSRGPGSFKTALFDSMYNLTGDEMDAMMRAVECTSSTS